jgi:signal transduction histidine kinase
MAVATNHNGSASKGHGMGLSGIRERVRELGGKLEVQSSGAGTSIIATLPVAAAASVGA